MSTRIALYSFLTAAALATGCAGAGAGRQVDSPSSQKPCGPAGTPDSYRAAVSCPEQPAESPPWASAGQRRPDSALDSAHN